MHALGRSGKHIFWLGQLQTPVACYRKGGCTPEGIPVNPPPEWWGVSPNNSPQMNERIEKNSKTIWETLSKFPYPAPFLPGEGVSFYLGQLKPALGALAASMDDLDSDSIRIWITLEMLAHYDEWTEMIVQALKKLAKRRKKIGLQKTIVAAVGSLVMGIAAPAAFAALFSAVNTANQAYIQAKQARQMAEDLKKAQAAFAESDPEFAKEVDRAQQFMERLAEQAPPETAPGGSSASPASATPASAPHAEGASDLTTTLAVGGGLAAVGWAVFSLFKH